MVRRTVRLSTLIVLFSTSAIAQPAAPSPPPSLASEAQQNMGTAQMLFKLGQTQSQLAELQQQNVEKDAYWKAYVEGIAQGLPHSTGPLPHSPDK